MILKIIVSGCNGSIGREIINYTKNNKDIRIVGGISRSNKLSYKFPVYNDFNDIKIKPDVIIDFSHKSLLNILLKYAVERKVGLVLATTGYNSSEEEKIYKASKVIPIFRGVNLSMGVNKFIYIIEKAVKLLSSEYDIEIVESHSNRKVDAPSGTAKLIYNCIKNNLFYNPNLVYSREGVRNTRDKREIGIHSIRGGSICGEHTVIFAGANDVIKVQHISSSKIAFVKTAIMAAKFLTKKNNGYYIIDDLLKIKEVDKIV